MAALGSAQADRPLILLSNDDGIASEALHALAGDLREGGGVEVLVVAPERERSAASHSITLHKPLRVVEHGAGAYAVSGTPVDCVYVTLFSLSSRTPDLVVSGINRGLNIGADIFYSGTVAAAAEAAMRDIPAVAVSCEVTGDPEVDATTVVSARRFVSRMVASEVHRSVPPGTVLNVNVPARAGKRYVWTRLGERCFDNDVLDRRDPRGRRYFWIGGGGHRLGSEEGTDSHAILHALISVTPLHLDRTAHEVLAHRPRVSVDGYEEHGA